MGQRLFHMMEQSHSPDCDSIIMVENHVSQDKSTQKIMNLFATRSNLPNKTLWCIVDVFIFPGEWLNIYRCTEPSFGCWNTVFQMPQQHLHQTEQIKTILPTRKTGIWDNGRSGQHIMRSITRMIQGLAEIGKTGMRIFGDWNSQTSVQVIIFIWIYQSQVWYQKFFLYQLTSAYCFGSNNPPPQESISFLSVGCQLYKAFSIPLSLSRIFQLKHFQNENVSSFAYPLRNYYPIFGHTHSSGRECRWSMWWRKRLSSSDPSFSFARTSDGVYI